MKITGIYKIISPTNRIYIGQSIDITYRFKQYKNTSSYNTQTKLRNSINKYGLKKHRFEVVEECEIEKLNDRERYWQDFYNCLKNGLNCKLTTSSDKSGELSEETKNKIGKSNKGKIHNIGRIVSRETKDKLSKNHSRWNAGLTDNEVHDICKMYISGKTTQEINKKYPNVHYVTLSEIRRKKRYRHITTLYDINKPSKKGCKRKTMRKIICIEDNLPFDGLYEVAEYYNVSFNVISESALNNRRIRKINKTFKYV